MAALTGAAACICKGKRPLEVTKKICKIYIVLHGNGVRAREDAPPPDFRDGYANMWGQVGSDGEPNFFRLGEGLDPSANDIKLFRMVAPGMVFMSHIDINKDLRDTLLIHPLDNWLHHLKINTTLTPQQMAASSHQEHVDPNDEKFIKSRAIFRQLLQLFIKNDILINERVMTDLGKKGGSTGEHLDEFGVWIHRYGEKQWIKIMESTDPFLTPTGGEKEVTLKNLISHIVTQQGNNCTDYEFYIANCSPIPSDKRKVIGRLQSNITASKWNRPGEFSAVAFENQTENINFWLNTLYIHHKRLKLYHQGKESLNSFIEQSTPSEQQTKKLPQVPPQDTIWGMMDSEERQDHYKLINGLLHMYPYFLNVSGVNKAEIKNMMIFIIKTITTPFNKQIRGGQPHEKGASQITKYSGTVENVAGSDGASKVESGNEGYYTLSQGVASKVAAVIKGEYVIPGFAADEARDVISDYKEMLQSVYGMGQGETTDKISHNYPFKPDSVKTVDGWKELLDEVHGGGNKLRKKKTSKKRKRRRRKKTRRKKKKKRKNKTRKKKRRIKRKKSRRRKSK